LQELCRDHGCEVIISATTWDLAHAGGAQLPEALLSPITLRGRDEAANAYRIG
jgi:class 3 adenylate cyclase